MANWSKCEIFEVVDVIGKKVKLCCTSPASYRIEEIVPNYGPTIHYLCASHRKNLLPMCNPTSELKLTKLWEK